jgi:hypothetical protein
MDDQPGAARSIHPDRLPPAARILVFLTTGATNACTEGTNTRIKHVKRAAAGFRNLDNYIAPRQARPLLGVQGLGRRVVSRLSERAMPARTVPRRPRPAAQRRGVQELRSPQAGTAERAGLLPPPTLPLGWYQHS